MKYSIILGVFLAAQLLAGCGHSANKEACAQNFAPLETKVATLTKNVSTQADIISTLGNPDETYDHTDASSPSVTSVDYRYEVYEGGDNVNSPFCGQYRLIINNNVLAGVEKYEDYKAQ